MAFYRSGGGGDSSTSAKLLGVSSKMNRNANLSMTLTFDSTGKHKIAPFITYTYGTNTQVAIVVPDNCTFTNATLLEKNEDCYVIDAMSTSVTVTMATGLVNSTSFFMIGGVLEITD